jgi:phytoene dehydrogenase-like protein
LAASAANQRLRSPLFFLGAYLADPSRSIGNVRPVWAYAHVSHGYDGDATEAILNQLERFAPGNRERIVGLRITRPADFTAGNPNFVGSDILTGARTVPQLILGARPTLDPYSTGSCARPPPARPRGTRHVRSRGPAPRPVSGLRPPRG